VCRVQVYRHGIGVVRDLEASRMYITAALPHLDQSVIKSAKYKCVLCMPVCVLYTRVCVV